jgi:hypothetical protein
MGGGRLMRSKLERIWKETVTVPNQKDQPPPLVKKRKRGPFEISHESRQGLKAKNKSVTRTRSTFLLWYGFERCYCRYRINTISPTYEIFHVFSKSSFIALVTQRLAVALLPK